MSDNKANTKKWYKHGWGLVAAIIFFPYFLIWYAWAESSWSKNSKIAVTTATSIIMLPFIIAIATAEPDENVASKQKTVINEKAEKDETVAAEPPEVTFSDKLLQHIDSGKAYDSGSYIKGDIPKGEYAFLSFEGSGKYYSEEDTAGNIIDNENFDSFGYVHVHDVGNITNDGVLIPKKSFKSLGMKGAKDGYEKLNNFKKYKDSGMYRVGVDIKPGQYVIESVGESYVEIASGPVGNSEIIDNNNFNGKYSVSVSAGQYLKINRGSIK